METKVCGRCKNSCPTQEFGSYYHKVTKKYRPGYLCRACRARKTADYRKKNPAYRQKLRVQQIARKYGLSEVEYQKMSESQNHCCLACGKKPDYPLYVDHCHQSGRVRGLLCSGCNSALGMVEDSPNVLRNLAGYLER